MNLYLLIQFVNAYKSLMKDEPPFLKALRYRKSELEQIKEELEHEHKMLLRILGFFDGGNKPEAPETKFSEKKTEKAETIPPPVKTMDPHLAILEKGIKKVVGIFRKSRMLKRSKSLRPLMKALINALGKSKQCQSETERIVQLETAIGEGLDYLQTSKMASRSKVLKEIKRILEETIDKKNQA